MWYVNSGKIDTEKIRQGDISEFELLYRQFCQSLVLFANKYVYDLSVAENLVQDVFTNIWQNRGNLNSSGNIKTYLYTSVKNRALNYIQRAKIERRYKETIVVEKTDFITPDKHLMNKELEERVNEAVQGLSERCRMIFLMSRHDNLSYAEIAEILGLSIKTVENHMGKAVKTLRKYLSDIIPFIF